jgi:hypothetical protein
LKTAATNIVLTAYQQLSPEEKQFVREQLELANPKPKKKKQSKEAWPFDEEALMMDLRKNALYLEP